MRAIHNCLKRPDRAVDAIFFAFTSVLLIIGMAGWYIADKFWVHL